MESELRVTRSPDALPDVDVFVQELEDAGLVGLG